MIYFNIFDILDLENVRIDTKIEFVSCLQPEIGKVMQKGVWPWFSRSCNKDRIFSLSPLDFLTPKTYPWEIFPKKIRTGRQKSRGVVPTPPPLRRFRLAKYLGCLRVNNDEICMKLHKRSIILGNKIVHNFKNCCFMNILIISMVLKNCFTTATTSTWIAI